MIFDFGSGFFLARTGPEAEAKKIWNQDKGMKKAKSVIVRLEGRAFVFEADISEEELIAEMISSLGIFIKRGFPIRVTQSSTLSMSKSQSMWSRILTSVKELGEWADDLKRLVRIHRGRA